MTPAAMNNSNQDYADHAASSFFTGAIVGALVALSLGTEEGRKISQKLFHSLKDISSDVGKDIKATPNYQQIEDKVADYHQEFRQSVSDLNSSIQTTGRQVIDRLHRLTGSSLGKDDQPLS